MAPNPWKVVGASVAGFSHIAEGIPCQDFHSATTSENGWFVCVVSDGAGSASRGAEGSREICEQLTGYLSVYLSEFTNLGVDPVIDEPDFRQTVTSGIELVRNLLETRTEAESLSEFHATVVGVVAGPTGGVFFHIGDGSACATDTRTLSPSVVSLPENGEYANETYFFTQPIWHEHLRLTYFGEECDLVVLMSDGVSPFAMGPGGKELHAPFFGPISNYFTKNDTDKCRAALIATLEKDAIRQITGDDKTLVWASRAISDV